MENKEQNNTINYEFLHIPVGRLIWASILSVGWYRVYWFYTNWKEIQKVTGKQMSPFWRSIFSVFWSREPFQLVLNQANELKYMHTYNVNFLVLFYFLTTIFFNLVGRANFQFSEPAWYFVLAMFLLLGEVITLIPLIKVQGVVNWIADKKERKYKKIGMAEIGLIIMGLTIAYLFSSAV
jgi:hypothetical protein